MTVNSNYTSNKLLQDLDTSRSSQNNTVSNVSPTLTTGTSNTVTATDSGDTASLSSQSKLFSQLHTLSESDPTEFKKVTAELAQELNSVSNSLTDPSEAHLLNGMASNLEKASQSGNFSDLFATPSSSSAASTISNPYATQASSSDPLAGFFSHALSR